jgi:hypothetical protein
MRFLQGLQLRIRLCSVCSSPITCDVIARSRCSHTPRFLRDRLPLSLSRQFHKSHFTNALQYDDMRSIYIVTNTSCCPGSWLNAAHHFSTSLSSIALNCRAIIRLQYLQDRISTFPGSTALPESTIQYGRSVSLGLATATCICHCVARHAPSSPYSLDINRQPALSFYETGSKNTASRHLVRYASLDLTGT